MPEPRKPVVLESMHQEEIAGFRVRIWANQPIEDKIHERYWADGLQKIITTLQLQKYQIGYDPELPDIIEAISKVPEVTAVEVTNSDGNGVVAYFEWP